jgi:hypothetical protein
VHARGMWEEIIMIVVDWISIDDPPELVEDYL